MRSALLFPVHVKLTTSVNYRFNLRERSQQFSWARTNKRSPRDAVIRVYDDAGNVIETHEHKGDFKEW
jgi:hypothetical protein